MTRDGRAGKALQVGEKHHVAWTFPTLYEYIFGCCLVDCSNLPDDVIGNIDHQQESNDDASECAIMQTGLSSVGFSYRAKLPFKLYTMVVSIHT